ncbi:thiolase family protein [Croceicoccus sp. BE223]|uniref:thiolase family protein n=1 Tax=Croceicoccus sp. BE223 TaxID=2817716 RepID=UPI00286799EA|nr:thiolase family protein [Croceicoccus sp. BE223]MDR7103707.1 acetyl-CoA acetyltransferase [Croceicoccus sp. BE223]
MPIANGRIEAAITGVGLCAPGRDNARPIMDVMLDAIDEALADAGLTLKDIDGIATFPLRASTKNDSPIDVTELKETLGIDLNFFSGGVEGPAQFTSIFDAVGAVMSGQARHVLCYRTLAQYTQQLHDRAHPRKPSDGYERVSGKWMYHRPFDVVSPVACTAMMFRRHMHEFGTTKEQLGHLVLNTRKNAARNPRAIYRDPMTMEDYLNARMICDPLGLYDCDALLDSSTVIIVSRLDAARDTRKKPLIIESISGRVGNHYSWDQFEPKWGMMALENGPHLWTKTDFKPKDVRVANLYDGFSPQTLIWLEALGFCGHGESGAFVDGGHRIALDGELPVNTGGGQLSGGRMHGFGLLWETCIQMWGEGGERQVPGNVNVGVAAAGGGPLAGSILLRRD